eukprot:480708-Alexandrium_andersonii.AAC.1
MGIARQAALPGTAASVVSGPNRLLSSALVAERLSGRQQSGRDPGGLRCTPLAGAQHSARSSQLSRYPGTLIVRGGLAAQELAARSSPGRWAKVQALWRPPSRPLRAR